MRILLVNPIVPQVDAIRDLHTENEAMEMNKIREESGPPLGLNDIAGVLRNEEVRIVDQKFENDKSKNYDFANAIYNEVRNFKPDIVGLTCITAHVNSAKKILRIVKDYNPKVLTVVGGIHTSLNPHDFCMPEVDLVVVGLGKRTMRIIVDEFKANYHKADFSKISGLAIRVNGELKFTKQLSELSRKDLADEHYLYYDRDEFFPDRDLTRRYNYMIEMKNLKVHYMNTALGCTDKCSFCGLWKFACGYYITRDVASIVREISSMDEYPVIRMVDAHTFGSVSNSRALFETLIKENIQHDYIVDVRTDTIAKHPDLFALAAKAGVKVAIMGFEATTDEELKKYNKRSTVANTIKAIETLHSVGILCAGNYIISPDYDEKDFERVAKFVDDHPVFFSGFTVMTPFPGTLQYEMMKDRIVIKNLDYYNLVNAVVKTKLPEDVFYNKIVELYKLSKRARARFIKETGIEI
jgi:radical SAM superfamily enzyme YgiQ (UPF0313 family)